METAKILVKNLQIFKQLEMGDANGHAYKTFVGCLEPQSASSVALAKTWPVKTNGYEETINKKQQRDATIFKSNEMLARDSACFVPVLEPAYTAICWPLSNLSLFAIGNPSDMRLFSFKFHLKLTEKVLSKRLSLISAFYDVDYLISSAWF